MVARNDITGDTIQTKGVSNAYRDNYDNIWKKDKSVQIRVKENVEDIGRCGCGRSPTGYCIGWHGLSEVQFNERKELYETGRVDLAGKEID